MPIKSFLEQIQSPVIHRHRMPGRVLELAFFKQGKTQLAADRVGGRILHRWKGMHEPVFGLPAYKIDHRCGCLGGNSPALIGRQDQPSHFINRLLAPGLPPIANAAHTFLSCPPHNSEHAVGAVLGKVQVSLVTTDDLLRTLRSAQMGHHGRVAEQFLEQGKISLSPGLKLNITHGQFVRSLPGTASLRLDRRFQSLPCGARKFLDHPDPPFWFLLELLFFFAFFSIFSLTLYSTIFRISGNGRGRSRGNWIVELEVV